MIPTKTKRTTMSSRSVTGDIVSQSAPGPECVTVTHSHRQGSTTLWSAEKGKQRMSQEQENQGRRLETARECAKDFLRPLVEAHWSLNRIISEQIGVNFAEYSLWIGKNKAITDQQYQQRIIQRGQLVVTHVGEISCFVKLDIAEIVAAIRDEERGYLQPTLVDLLSQEEPAPARSASRKKKYAGYRSYIGGNCQNCNEPLGFIETEGGRDRHYCNARCRVAHHRKQQREQKRAAVLQYNSELRDYWQEHSVRGEVLLRLQEILFQHGKEAARTATDAVLVALAAQTQVGNQEQFRLIDEILLGGEAISYPEIRLDEFRIAQGVEAWANFTSSTTLSTLRQMRGYLIELRQHEHFKEQGRKRLEALSR